MNPGEEIYYQAAMFMQRLAVASATQVGEVVDCKGISGIQVFFLIKKNEKIKKI
jgi:hypothetical protein